MQKAREACSHLRDYFEGKAAKSGTVLLLCDADGGVVFDLAVANCLIRMGHKVIFAVKAGFYFFSPTLEDMEMDPSVRARLNGGVVLHEPRLSKNDLLRSLREHRLVVIGDGTRERLNLYRVSVTFSRAWKEADVVLGKGWRAADVLLGSSHQYTRDVVCYWHGFNLDALAHFGRGNLQSLARVVQARKRLNLVELFHQGRVVVKKSLHGSLGSRVAAFNGNGAVFVALNGELGIAADGKILYAVIQGGAELGIVQHRLHACLADAEQGINPKAQQCRDGYG